MCCATNARTLLPADCGMTASACHMPHATACCLLPVHQLKMLPYKCGHNLIVLSAASVADPLFMAPCPPQLPPLAAAALQRFFHLPITASTWPQLATYNCCHCFSWPSDSRLQQLQRWWSNQTLGRSVDDDGRWCQCWWWWWCWWWWPLKRVLSALPKLAAK